ncbi:hypothetical protein G6F40_016617 [Rhizopus arrhizus]|nr:hypothetical protein G6F40_016617 [Rhizopus arrhizus]
MARLEAAQGDFGVLGDAGAASEVIERALGQDAEGHALAQHGAGHGVKCAVAAGGDDHALRVLRARDGGRRRLGQPGRGGGGQPRVGREAARDERQRPAAQDLLDQRGFDVDHAVVETGFGACLSVVRFVRVQHDGAAWQAVPA